MRKLLLPLFLLLIAGLLVTGAFLPQITAAVMDGAAGEAAATAPMQSVELKFGADNQQPGYMMRKLALEQWMTTVPITADETSMTEDEVYAAVETGMEPYLEAGIFEWFDFTYRMAEPYFGLDPYDKSNYMVFWGVTLVNESDPYQSLFLHIDDETGRILYIKYETYGDDRLNYYFPENHRLMMEGFVDAYYSPLELTQADLAEYKDLLGTSVEELDLTDDVTAVRYSFDDTQYGEIRVEFYITPSGFYVYFPG